MIVIPKDVTRETQISLDKFRTVRYVHALNEDGSDGPWIGMLEKINDKELNPALLGTLRAGSIPEARIWAIYPIRESDRYAIQRRPVGYAVGMRHAANQLRDYIAERNSRSGH